MKSYLLVVLLLLQLVMHAQERHVNNDAIPESEVTATINPQNKNNLIVAAMREVNNNQGRSQSRLGIHYSLDGGNQWLKSPYDGKINPEEPETLIIGDPVLTYDGLGTAYLSHIIWTGTTSPLTTQLYVAFSENGGLSWTPKLIRSSTQSVYDKPWIMADLSPSSPHYNDVYVVFTRVDTEGINTESGIYLIKKEATSEEFSSQTVKINTANFNITQFSNIAIDKLGRLYVCFVGNDGSQTGLYVVRSDDGGQTFHPEKQILRLGMYYSNFGVLTTILNQKGLDRLYPCPQIGTDNSEGPHQDRIYVSWTDIEGGPINYGLDVFLSYSDDSGNTWTSPKVVHANTPLNNHQYYSTLAVHSNGSLLLAWYDRREDDRNEKTHYFFTLSRDGGETFEAAEALSTQSTDFNWIGFQNSDFGIGEYNQMITAGEYAIPFWADGRSNNGDIDIYLAKIKVDEATSIFERYTSVSSGLQFERVYPNPVREEVKLRFHLEKPTWVKLQLFDAFGKKYHTLWNKTLSVGKHEFTYKRNDLASGIYYFKLETLYGFVSQRVVFIGL